MRGNGFQSVKMVCGRFLKGKNGFENTLKMKMDMDTCTSGHQFHKDTLSFVEECCFDIIELKKRVFEKSQIDS